MNTTTNDQNTMISNGVGHFWSQNLRITNEVKWSKAHCWWHSEGFDSRCCCKTGCSGTRSRLCRPGLTPGGTVPWTWAERCGSRTARLACGCPCQRLRWHRSPTDEVLFIIISHLADMLLQSHLQHILERRRIGIWLSAKRLWTPFSALQQLYTSLSNMPNPYQHYHYSTSRGGQDILYATPTQPTSSILHIKER